MKEDKRDEIRGLKSTILFLLAEGRCALCENEKRRIESTPLRHCEPSSHEMFLFDKQHIVPESFFEQERGVGSSTLKHFLKDNPYVEQVLRECLLKDSHTADASQITASDIRNLIHTCGRHNQFVDEALTRTKKALDQSMARPSPEMRLVFELTVADRVRDLADARNAADQDNRLLGLSKLTPESKGAGVNVCSLRKVWEILNGLKESLCTIDNQGRACGLRDLPSLNAAASATEEAFSDMSSATNESIKKTILSLESGWEEMLHEVKALWNRFAPQDFRFPEGVSSLNYYFTGSLCRATVALSVLQAQGDSPQLPHFVMLAQGNCERLTCEILGRRFIEELMTANRLSLRLSMDTVLQRIRQELEFVACTITATWLHLLVTKSSQNSADIFHPNRLLDFYVRIAATLQAATVAFFVPKTHLRKSFDEIVDLRFIRRLTEEALKSIGTILNDADNKPSFQQRVVRLAAVLAVSQRAISIAFDEHVRWNAIQSLHLDECRKQGCKFDLELRSLDRRRDQIGRAYDGSHRIFRFLRALGWDRLLNLGYFHWARAYLLLTSGLRPFQEELVRRVVSQLSLRSGARVLDVACGTGWSTRMLSCNNTNATVIGVDILEENILVAKELSLAGVPPADANFSFRQGDARDLSNIFTNEKFDAIVCIEAGFHFRQEDRPDGRREFINGCAEILKPGGVLLLTDFVWEDDKPDEIEEYDDEGIVRAEWQFQRFAGRSEYEEFAKENGLSITKKDWSSHVTSWIQHLSNIATWRMLRPVLCLLYRQLRKFDSDDWTLLKKILKAHDKVRRHSRYMFLRFTKSE